MSEEIEIKNLKEVIKEEYIKCIQSPTYFIKKYCYIQHPTRGRIPFVLYPFQEKVIQLWVENNYNIVLKSRQLGISTLAAAYAFWLILFHKDKNVLCIATKQETAKNMVTKLKFMFDNIPNWLKIPVIEDNKLTLKLSNGSQIKAVSAAGDSGRSEAVSLLLIDECISGEHVICINRNGEEKEYTLAELFKEYESSN
jgi:phage terminase large subunit-like protein